VLVYLNKTDDMVVGTGASDGATYGRYDTKKDDGISPHGLSDRMGRSSSDDGHRFVASIDRMSIGRR